MTSTEEIRKVEIKQALVTGWQWVDTSVMTFEQAIEVAKRAVKSNDFVYGVRISRLGKTWVEEFSGNQDFEYVGVDLYE